MDKINVIHHMNEFRNILSYATNIGFFFGAGTSCAFGLPTIWKLTEQTKYRLDHVCADLPDAPFTGYRSYQRKVSWTQ